MKIRIRLKSFKKKLSRIILYETNLRNIKKVFFFNLFKFFFKFNTIYKFYNNNKKKKKI